MTSTCLLCVRRQGENSLASRADDRPSRLCTPSEVYAVRSQRPRSASARARPAFVLAVGASRVPDLRCRVGGSGGRVQPGLYRAGREVGEGGTAGPRVVDAVV